MVIRDLKFAKETQIDLRFEFFLAPLHGTRDRSVQFSVSLSGGFGASDDHERLLPRLGALAARLAP